MAAACLEAREAALRAEQAVKGLDALDEVSLHPILAAGFAAAGLGVIREQRFPSATASPATRIRDGDPATDTDRERCDLVLTPEPGQVIADPIAARRTERARRKAVQGTLFEAIAEQQAMAGTAVVGHGSDSRATLDPGDAMWLEVKVVGQIAFEHGVPMANRAYGSQLVRGVVGDLTKLGRDPLIVHGAAVMVVFTADQHTAEHDLLVVAHKCVDKGLTAASPIVRTLAILDRVGNACAAVGVFAASRP